MKVLKDFIHGFDFLHMRPDNSVIRSVAPSTASARALIDPDKAMAIFVRGGGASTVVTVDLPAGSWIGEWIDTKSGRTVRETTIDGGEVRALAAPDYQTDIALRLRKQGR